MSLQMKQLVLIATLVSFFTPTSLLAQLRRGGMDGGGGNAVVCRNSTGQINSAQLLDLYEGQALYDLQPTQFDANLTYKEIALEVGNRMSGSSLGQNLTMSINTTADSSGTVLNRYFAVYDVPRSTLVKESIEQTLKAFRVLPEGIDLAPISDSNHFILPRNCKVEQVAIYRDDLEKLFFVKDIWEAFDEVNKAALIVHETVYKELRSSKEVNSERTRTIVAQTFSGQSFKSLFHELDTEKLILCNSLDPDLKNRFVLSPSLSNPDKWVRAHFLMINGITPVTLTKAHFPIEYTPLSQVPNNIQQEQANYFANNFIEGLYNKREVYEIGVFLSPDKPRKFFINLSNSSSQLNPDSEVEFECRRGGFQCKENGDCSFWADPNKIP